MCIRDRKEGEGLKKAIELATKIAGNAPMTNYALTNVLPRIVEGGQDVRLMLESMISAISQDSPEAKRRLSEFLAGKSKKVGE